jgi:hypothetical protein
MSKMLSRRGRPTCIRVMPSDGGSPAEGWIPGEFAFLRLIAFVAQRIREA